MKPLKSGPLALGFSLLVSAASARASEGKPEIQLYSSIGTTHRLTVRGRALKKSGERGSTVISRNARRLFANSEWKNVPVRVSVAGQSQDVTTDEEGLFSAEFVRDDEGLPAGPHEARAEVHGVTGAGTVHVIGKDDVVVVSDFDDTVAITHVTSRRRMLRSALLLGEHTQPRVPGMAELYQALREPKADGSSAAFVYLSGSPIQYHHRIRSFLARNGFPPGGIFLRQFDAGTRDPAGFKTPRLKQMLLDLPEQRFLFFGDSGERDPEIYREVSASAGARRLATYIRLVTPDAPGAKRFAGQLAFKDAGEAAADLCARGLITEEAAKQVARAAMTPETSAADGKDHPAGDARRAEP